MLDNMYVIFTCKIPLHVVKVDSFFMRFVNFKAFVAIKYQVLLIITKILIPAQ